MVVAVNLRLEQCLFSQSGQRALLRQLQLCVPTLIASSCHPQYCVHPDDSRPLKNRMPNEVCYRVDEGTSTVFGEVAVLFGGIESLLKVRAVIGVINCCGIAPLISGSQGTTHRDALVPWAETNG
jgi:hypothetical protein